MHFMSIGSRYVNGGYELALDVSPCGRAVKLIFIKNVVYEVHMCLPILYIHSLSPVIDLLIIIPNN